MKVCLIRPPFVSPAKNIIETLTPPIGVAYIAGALRESGLDVSLIDGLGESLDTRHAWENDTYLYGLSFQEIIDRIPKDVSSIGIHAGFTFDWPACKILIDMIRKAFPVTPLIGGGEHASALPELTLLESALDYIVIGEGEETAIELFGSLGQDGFEAEKINGIAFFDDSHTFIKTGSRDRVRDIDSIALPAWDLTPLSEYLDRGFGWGVNRGRSMPMLASRGCPYQCTFCSNPSMWTTRWVIRDPDLLLDEMEESIREYGVTNFDFYDLTFVINKQWILNFCRKIEERGLKITWQLPSGTRSEVIDSEVSKLLYSSGCRNLSYSPESGSESVLNRIKKKIKLEPFIDSIRHSREKGLNIKCNIILGFPGETLKEVLDSFKFIVRMAIAGAHDLNIWSYSPYPGSELFDDLMASGRLKLDNAYFDSLRSYSDASNTTSFCENFTDRELKQLRFAGRCLFYLVSWSCRPIRPFRMIRNIKRGTHESRMEMGLANIIRRKWFYSN
jgi:anaerobic magnesium-protoporphyrin IX monomethyl ester cyclase